jgi:hypothetical protein
MDATEMGLEKEPTTLTVLTLSLSKQCDSQCWGEAAGMHVTLYLEIGVFALILPSRQSLYARPRLAGDL